VATNRLVEHHHHHLYVFVFLQLDRFFSVFIFFAFRVMLFFRRFVCFVYLFVSLFLWVTLNIQSIVLTVSFRHVFQLNTHVFLFIFVACRIRGIPGWWRVLRRQSEKTQTSLRTHRRDRLRQPKIEFGFLFSPSERKACIVDVDAFRFEAKNKAA